jgi:hypothetical protein
MIWPFLIFKTSSRIPSTYCHSDVMDFSKIYKCHRPDIMSSSLSLLLLLSTYLKNMSMRSYGSFCCLFEKRLSRTHDLPVLQMHMLDAIWSLLKIWYRVRLCSGLLPSLSSSSAPKLRRTQGMSAPDTLEKQSTSWWWSSCSFGPCSECLESIRIDRGVLLLSLLYITFSSLSLKTEKFPDYGCCSLFEKQQERLCIIFLSFRNPTMGCVQNKWIWRSGHAIFSPLYYILDPDLKEIIESIKRFAAFSKNNENANEWSLCLLTSRAKSLEPIRIWPTSPATFSSLHYIPSSNSKINHHLRMAAAVFSKTRYADPR